MSKPTFSSLQRIVATLQARVPLARMIPHNPEPQPLTSQEQRVLFHVYDDMSIAKPQVDSTGWNTVNVCYPYHGHNNEYRVNRRILDALHSDLIDSGINNLVEVDVSNHEFYQKIRLTFKEK